MEQFMIHFRTKTANAYLQFTTKHTFLFKFDMSGFMLRKFISIVGGYN